jgi:hypothetical protein
MTLSQGVSAAMFRAKRDGNGRVRRSWSEDMLAVPDASG